MKVHGLVLAGLALASCDLQPQEVAVAPDRQAAFVGLVEQSNCELDPVSHEAVHAAGFSDAEIDAIARQLVSEGQAGVERDGRLVLVTGNCL